MHQIAADGSVARTSRLAGNGHRRTRHTNRPVQQIRLRATHCTFNDNVLEPQRDSLANAVSGFRFVPDTGQLTANTFRVEPANLTGPGTDISISQNLVFFSNEQGCGISSYRLDAVTGTFARAKPFQAYRMVTGTRLPQIHLTPSGRFL